MATVLNHLVSRLWERADWNPSIQVRPVCILWPDKERLWEAAIPLLRSALSNVLVLGKYDPSVCQGPALWIRAVLDGALPLLKGDTEESIPVVYLPGWSRADLRAIASCPQELRFLAEFQYRGVIFAHHNGRDWTPSAFVTASPAKGGLGLELAQDAPTREALHNALTEFLVSDLETYRSQRIDSTVLNDLIVSSPERDILDWLEQYPVQPVSWSAEQNKAFSDICTQHYGWNPASDGPHRAARSIIEAAGQWSGVWKRYAEMPTRYPRVYDHLVSQRAPADLFSDRSHYPIANETDERTLKDNLLALPLADPVKARAEIVNLESKNAERRGWVWAGLGKANLARALEYLSIIARLSSEATGSDLDDYKARYIAELWKIDDAALRAQEGILTKEEREAISHALKAIYAPWVDQHAQRLQELATQTWPESLNEPPAAYVSDACWLFVDGLRFDLAMRLVDCLRNTGYGVDIESQWAPLPSVTAVGKYLNSPAVPTARGFVQDGDPALMNAEGKIIESQRHKAMLADAGFEFLDPSSVGTPGGRAWTEDAEIDSRGHEAGAKLARELPSILDRVSLRIQELLDSGWKRVIVVTDHGWLLLPGAMDKAGLPAGLTCSKWGRSGVLADSAPNLHGEYRWKLAPEFRMITAPGARSFMQGKEFSHGGISAQECIVPRLQVHGVSKPSVGVEIASIGWRGLRCELVVSGQGDGLFCDIRTAPAKADTTIVSCVKAIHDGVVSLVVDRDDLEGHSATIVVCRADGTLVAQEATLVGGA